MSPDELILRRIALAEADFQAHALSIATEPSLMGPLEAYRREIQNNWDLLGHTQVTAFCAMCGGQRDTGCCFAGAERWYDPLLLLINLLLGAELPHHRWSADRCFFLGPEGCLLRARWSICLNFFCPELSETLSPQDLGALRRQAGAEIWAGLELEKALTAWLKRHAPGGAPLPTLASAS